MQRTLSLAFLGLLSIVTLAGFITLKSDSGQPLSRALEVKNWTIDKAHTNVGFRVRHLGITNVEGEFSDYQATLRLDPADVRTLQAETIVNVTSIDTGVERRDNHLRSADFFAAEEFPQMTFKSTGVKNVRGSKFTLAGNLTIRGTTRLVELEAELLGPIAGPGGKQRVGFEAETTINRMDYGLKWNNLTEAGGLVVSEDVNISLQIEAISE